MAANGKLFVVFFDGDFLQCLEVLLDDLPFETRMAGGLESAVEFFSHNERKEAAEEVSAYGFIALMENGSRLENGFHFPECGHGARRKRALETQGNSPLWRCELLHQAAQHMGYRFENLRLSIDSVITRFVKVGPRAVHHGRMWYVHVVSAFSLAHLHYPNQM